MTRARRYSTVLPLVLCGLLASACGSSGAAGSSNGPVVLGATLSVTGGLGSIGGPQKAGYEQLVADLNAAGGVTVGQAKRKVTLKILDNRSDPATASQQANELTLKDNVAVLLGACTPPVNQPIAQVAEKNRVPFVTSCFPLGAFRSAGGPAGWKYSWDFHFSEQDQADVLLGAADLTQTNKKVALFTDNEADGVIQRGLFAQAAARLGYTVVGDYTFPVGQSDFSSFVADAKAKGADVVLGQMIPPDGIALVKQIKSLQYVPKVLAIAKGADTSSWTQGLGRLGDGTVHNGFWTADPAVAGTSQVLATLGKQLPDAASLGLAAATYSVGQLAADAITRAGTTDPGKVGAALTTTDMRTVFAAVKFDPDHTSKTPVTAEQWQNGVTRQAYPKLDGVSLQAPPPGLQ